MYKILVLGAYFMRVPVLTIDYILVNIVSTTYYIYKYNGIKLQEHDMVNAKCHRD